LSDAIGGPNGINDEQMRIFKGQIQMHSARQIFIGHLNKYRTNHNCVVKAKVNYTSLCDMMFAVLDVCHRDMDV
jgi:hypothetical protein